MNGPGNPPPNPPGSPPGPQPGNPDQIINQTIGRLVGLAQGAVDLGKMALVPWLPRCFRLHQVEAGKTLSLLLQGELLEIEKALIQEGIASTGSVTKTAVAGAAVPGPILSSRPGRPRSRHATRASAAPSVRGPKR